jgi:hypothetical protein
MGEGSRIVGLCVDYILKLFSIVLSGLTIRLKHTLKFPRLPQIQLSLSAFIRRQASHYGGPGSVSGSSMWNFEWKRGH